MYDVRARLMSEQDLKFREFQRKLIPGDFEIIGVRTPVERAVAKEIVKDDWRAIIRDMKTDYLEERMVRGFVISSAKMELSERLPLIDSQVALMNNWAVCDQFDYKPKAGEREEYFGFVKSYLDRPGEFEKRFGAVMLMKYIDEEHIDEILALLDRVRHDGYYLKMGVAWTLSMCFVRFPEKTEKYFENCTLDDFTYRKSLQKTLESFRCDDGMKAKIKGLRARIRET